MRVWQQGGFTGNGCCCASLPAALRAVCVFGATLCFLAQGASLWFMNFALLLSNTRTYTMIISAVLAAKLNGICAMVFFVFLCSSDTLEGTCVEKASH